LFLIPEIFKIYEGRRNYIFLSFIKFISQKITQWLSPRVYLINMDNTLENIIKEKKTEELARLDAIIIVESLFVDLLDREKDILIRRFGLKGDKGETLEKIGNLHKLTRERVRQIESASIKKIKKLDKLETSVQALKGVVHSLLADHGGLMGRDYLLDILTVICLEINSSLDHNHPDYETRRKIYRNHFDFLISKLLGDHLELVEDSENFNSSVKKKDGDVSHLEELASDLLKKVQGASKTLSTDEILSMLKQLGSYLKNTPKMAADSLADISSIFKSQLFADKAEVINDNKTLYSLIQAIKTLEQNKYGEWGMANWGEVKPKTVNDKIYLILKHSGEPLHFTDIAKKINEMKFDRKEANAATVHNELILDERYNLVGRGTYGLKEWVK